MTINGKFVSFSLYRYKNTEQVAFLQKIQISFYIYNEFTFLTRLKSHETQPHWTRDQTFAEEQAVLFTK